MMTSQADIGSAGQYSCEGSVLYSNFSIMSWRICGGCVYSLDQTRSFFFFKQTSPYQ